MRAIFDKLLDPSIPALQRELDLTMRRTEAIASNIANAETPQYRAVDLNFANELQRAFGENSSPLLTTNSKHLDLESSSSAHLTPDLSGATKPDGNNVDIDIQMGRLAYNNGRYTAAVRLLRKKLGFIKFAIREGGR